MASGMEMMLKSVLGIDPNEIRQAGEQIQQSFRDAMKRYDADTKHTHEMLAAIQAGQMQINAKLDAILLRERFDNGTLGNGAVAVSIPEHSKQ